jgi:hypothetical protein
MNLPGVDDYADVARVYVVVSSVEDLVPGIA